MPDVKNVHKKCSIQLIRDVSGITPSSVQDDILVQEGRMATEQHVNGKFTFLFSDDQAFQFIISVVVAFGRQRKPRKPRPLRLP